MLGREVLREHLNDKVTVQCDQFDRWVECRLPLPPLETVRVFIMSAGISGLSVREFSRFQKSVNQGHARYCPTFLERPLHPNAHTAQAQPCLPGVTVPMTHKPSLCVIESKLTADTICCACDVVCAYGLEGRHILRALEAQNCSNNYSE
ncbi:hypothetical protein J6590_075833 [Homalodisca vitripennis]|nr:hypothetical protein J6590_075833 [Homalodisca vitripennis]